MQQTLAEATSQVANHEPVTTKETPPERQGIYWGGNNRVIADTLHVVGQLGSFTNEDIAHNSVAWVKQGCNEYFNSRETITVPLPETYSTWDEEFGDGNGLYRGQKVEQNGQVVQFGIPSHRAKAALRILTGGGHYAVSEYTLVDCVPLPVLYGPEGAIAIAPVEVRVSD